MEIKACIQFFSIRLFFRPVLFFCPVITTAQVPLSIQPLPSVLFQLVISRSKATLWTLYCNNESRSFRNGKRFIVCVLVRWYLLIRCWDHVFFYFSYIIFIKFSLSGQTVRLSFNHDVMKRFLVTTQHDTAVFVIVQW